MTVNDRYTWSEDGAIDELVLSNAWVHLERMDSKHYMLIVANDKGHFHLNVRRPVPFEVLIDGKPHAGEWEGDPTVTPGNKPI